MPAPTTATLHAWPSGECSIVSNNFVVSLDQPAPLGGVEVMVSSTVGGDIITTSPFTILFGDTSGTFTLTPTVCGNRDISITTNPVLALVNSPATFNATCACPDDSGTNDRVETWTRGIISTIVCPPTFSVLESTIPSSLEAKSLYCTTSPMSFTLTE